MKPNNWFPAASHPFVIALAMLTLTSAASAEWNEKVLYSFQGGANGSVPAGGVVFDKAGDLYGVTFDGVVFQLKPPVQKGRGWTENMLYVFQGVSKGDGSTPSGGLVIDSAGNLYGVTAYGGTGNCVLLGSVVGCGTVYEVSPPKEKGGAWKETILYSFPTAKEGYLPNGDLVFDSAGNLYGATTFGGTKGTTCDNFYGGQCGTVFELSPPKSKGGKWTEKVLHSFASGTDGANPNGGLVLDGEGNVYGTTSGGGDESGECGAVGCGTTFEIKPPATKGGAWKEKILYRFHGQDGATPTAGVVFGGSGELYGTVSAGAISGNGAVFSLVATGGLGGWKETALYRFQDGNDGFSPRSALTLDRGGNLYGTALGGQIFRGVVFRLKPAKIGQPWTFSLLYNFEGSPDAANPAAALIFDTKGGCTAQHNSVVRAKLAKVAAVQCSRSGRKKNRGRERFVTRQNAYFSTRPQRRKGEVAMTHGKSVAGWLFFAIVAVLVGWSLALPLQLDAQNTCPTPSQGQNAVYNPTCSNGPVVGSSSFIDASMFAQSGFDLCKVLNGILRGTSYPAAGAVIDARGLANSNPPTSMTCTTANPSPWAGITNPPPSTILLPATGGTSPNPIIIPSTWALPPNTRLVGEGDGIPSTNSPGTTIQAASGLASGTAMISFGLSSLCTAVCTGISAEKLTLDGQGQSIKGIGNGFSQSLSYVDHVRRVAQTLGETTNST